jgi:hypothetical protein
MTSRQLLTIGVVALLLWYLHKRMRMPGGTVALSSSEGAAGAVPPLPHFDQANVAPPPEPDPLVIPEAQRPAYIEQERAAEIAANPQAAYIGKIS